MHDMCCRLFAVFFSSLAVVRIRPLVGRENFFPEVVARVFW